MYQSAHEDLERWNNPDDGQIHWHRQSAPNGPSLSSSFVDSSEPFFVLYSQAAEEQDNRMVERWQKDAKGILIFTGLFSIAVAVLLVVTVQDLRPNSQDTSAFYLGNIYEVLADPNATRASIPTPVSKPPPFSPPRYAVWVNSLLFLSLAMGVSCGLLATSMYHWARRYIRLTQPSRCSPEKRARIRAFYASGVDRMHILWAVEGLPTLLHLSMFLFLGGLAIFLFNIDRGVFICVVSWIGLFSIVYGLITLLPSIHLDSPYSTPLSKPAWLLYARMRYVTFSVFTFVVSYCSIQTWVRFGSLRDQYRDRMLGGVEKRAEERAEDQSSKIDVRILGWTINALNDDDSLEKFFEAIPGLFDSKLVKDLEINFHEPLLETFWGALDRFIGRTLSSNWVTESVKLRRYTICRNIMNTIPCSEFNMTDHLRSHSYKAPVTIEKLQAIARWIPHRSRNVSYAAQIGFVKNIAEMPEHDGRWVAVASDVYDLPDLHEVALSRDNAILAILIYVCCQVKHSDELGLVEALTQFHISYTLPRLQHDFCTLWNEFVQDAKRQGSYSTPVHILRLIRHHYIDLHGDSTASPTLFFPSTDPYDPILLRPSSYPLCDIASHHPGSAAHISILPPTQPDDSKIPSRPSPRPSTSGGSIFSQPIKGTSFISSQSHPATPSKIGDSPQATAATSHATHPPEQITQQDIVATGAGSASNPYLRVSPFPSGPPPPYVRPLFGAKHLAVTLPHIQARGPVNMGNKFFANAVMQLLVHSPPFWNTFREVGDQLKGLREAGGLAPLVHATIRVLEEFSPASQQPLQQAAGGMSSEDGGGKNGSKEHHAVDSFEPTYMYDAMKKKGQLKHLLDGKHQGAKEFLGLYLDALDEELVELRTYISTHEPASTASVEKLKGKAQSAEDQTEVEKRDNTASSVESPISRIFGGKSRLAVRVPNQPDTITFETWRSLRLNIQPDSVHTIQDALAQVSQPQPVPVGQSSSSEATQQVLLEALPPILVLHLERFLYDSAADGTKRVSKPVQLAPELEIPLEIMVPVFGKSTEPMHYKLHGVLYHNGESAGSGHYTADVLHANGDGGSGESWLHIDDEAVSTVRHKDVFEGRYNEQGDDRCVYMLFYCRTTSSESARV